MILNFMPVGWRASEAKYAAQAAVYLVHEGDGELADRGFEIGLVEGDQRGDVDHGISRQSARDRGGRRRCRALPPGLCSM